jgi:osmoprotectant transport system substrate-binding protein
MSYRIPARLAGLVLAAGLLAACGGGDEGGDDGDDPLAADGGGGCVGSDGDAVVVGSANFSENVLLAEIYAQSMEAAGVTVERKLNIGSRETYIPALQDGSIDLMPEYSGNTLLYFDEDAAATDSDAVYDALAEALPDGCQILEQSEAEDKDSLVVTQETAQSDGLTLIPSPATTRSADRRSSRRDSPAWSASATSTGSSSVSSRRWTSADRFRWRHCSTVMSTW